MRTLRGRLLLGTAIGTGLVLSASALVLYTMVRAALWAEFDESLASKARSLAALVEQDGDDIELEFDEASLPEYVPAEHAEYYQFWTSGEHVVARSASLGDGNLGQISGTSGETVYETVLLPDGRRGRKVQLTFTARKEEGGLLGQPGPVPSELILAVARETVDVDRALGRLRLHLLCGCAGAILVSVVVLSWFVRRGLKPLGRVAADIAAIGEDDLSSRLDGCDAPAELGPVVARLNELLARLETAFARERAFTADVAHELRTPLAGLRATLEVSLSKDREANEYRGAMTTSLAVGRQMQRMVENLLELARADAGQLEVANETVDLVALLKGCWAEFAERAAERQLNVTWELAEPCPITIDRTKCCLVLNNIFDNAVTYTDAGGQVTIALQQENGLASVRVVNTGSTIAEEDAEKVFDRFWRGDPTRAPNGSERRYGLGLPLCRRIATILRGSITVSTARGGTFAATVVFPLENNGMSTRVSTLDPQQARRS